MIRRADDCPIIPIGDWLCCRRESAGLTTIQGTELVTPDEDYLYVAALGGDVKDDALVVGARVVFRQAIPVSVRGREFLMVRRPEIVAVIADDRPVLQ